MCEPSLTTVLQIYMAKVTDATTAAGYSAGWFKIAEIGLASDNPDYWGTEVLNVRLGHFVFVTELSGVL